MSDTRKELKEAMFHHLINIMGPKAFAKMTEQAIKATKADFETLPEGLNKKMIEEALVELEESLKRILEIHQSHLN